MAIWASSSPSPLSLFSSLSGKAGAEQGPELQPESAAEVEIQVNDGVAEDGGDMEKGELVVALNLGAPFLSEEQEYDAVVVTLEEEKVTNKLNKNNENFDKQESNINVEDVISPDDTVENTPEEASLYGSLAAGGRGDRTRNRIPGYHYHHHSHSEENHMSDEPQQQTQEQNPDQKQQAFMLKSHRGKGETPTVLISEELEVNSETSTTPQALEETNGKTAMLDALRTRGLIPFVIGAYHYTPQSCVNVSLSDDAKFATFHIERPLEETS
ncbi:hypothetical protein BGX34_001759 [Mortierella sp. NVP85]|nr:hypothetical protein BGX34_001759 [Mortierella sp. NVP85]